MNGTTAYILSKKYTDNTAIGLGALKGAPCQVQSIEKVDGVTTITLKWKDNEDVNHTTSFDIDDGIGVIGAHTDSDNHLIFEMSDGTEIDVGGIAADAYTKEEIGDITDLPIAGKNVIENISDIYDEVMSGGGGDIQHDSLPPASVSEIGKIYQYTGTTTSDFVKGYFYECVYKDSAYKWKQINTQDPGSAEIETDPIDFNNF